MKLHNEHKESIYYHPVTGMCYRNVDGVFWFAGGRLWLPRQGWVKSGMTSGFILILEVLNNA